MADFIRLTTLYRDARPETYINVSAIVKFWPASPGRGTMVLTTDSNNVAWQVEETVSEVLNLIEGK